MSTQTLTITLPDTTMATVRDRAQQTNRTVEAEVADAVVNAFPSRDELPLDLKAAVAALDLLDDTALHRAFESRLSAEASVELESLTFKERRTGLTPADEVRRRDLIRQYERAMLVRARAAAVLRQRGHELSATP